MFLGLVPSHFTELDEVSGIEIIMTLIENI
jgi:hypothetical protein